MKKSNNGIRLLKIWEILRSETDENSPIDTVELIKKLDSMGLKCDRRTLYDDVKTLNKYGCEVLQERGRSNRYYVVNRSFDEAELHILLDAVQAACFITDKKTVELTDKIASLAGSRKAEIVKKNIVKFNTVKSVNEHIYYSVDTILSAIKEGKKIEFLYFDYDVRHQKIYRKGGNKYLFNPIFTAFSDGNYYVVGFYDKYEDVSVCRVDRMEKVNIVDKEISPDRKKQIGKLADKKIWFDMFTGEQRTVTFSARDDNKVLGVVYDKFGTDVSFVRHGDGTVTFSADVQLSPPFFAWICELGDALKVVAPQDVVDWVKGEFYKRIKRYEEK